MGLPKLPSSEALNALNEQYWRSSFNTKLNDDEERAYQEWLVRQSGLQGRDLRNDEFDYDTRGFFKAGESSDERGHGTDRFKKPNHPTFSNESMYHGSPDPWGGVYEGGQWSEDSGKSRYRPASSMFRKTHDSNAMKKYFQKYEPESELIIPHSEPG